MTKDKPNITLAAIDLLILDLDGVLYKGYEPVEHAVESVDRYYKLNKKIAFFTNNSTLTRNDYVKKISSMGINVRPEQIYTSSTIAAKILSEQFDVNAVAFVLGENGLLTAIKNIGFKLLNETHGFDEIIRNNKIKCDFVIVGLDRVLTYKKLAATVQLINRGADFYATNKDSSLPTEYGFLPGSGAIVEAVSVTAGKPPDRIFGKPVPDGINQILADYNVSPGKAIMIGDRPETDILCAKNAGISSALTLTGVINKDNITNIPQNALPDIILNNLSEL